MNPHFPKLFTPLSWDGLTVKNRIVLAPMTRARAGSEMTANELMADYYRQRAGAGVLLSEGTFISREAVGWRHAPGIWTDAQAEAWKPVVAAVHDHDAPFFLQLWHTGRASHSEFLDGQLPVAPSPVRHTGDPVHTPSGEKRPHETPRALRLDELPRIVDDYVQATKRAKAAGFDGIEIHAANGYLLDEFLQSKTNHREDQYGGSIENRFRLLREVVEACSAVWSAPRVGVRIAPNGTFNDMGSPDFRETFTYVAQQLAAFDLAWLHVVDGLAFGFHELGEPMTLSEFRQVYPGRLMGNCGYTRDKAEEQIAAGHADLISFGRPFISNPDLAYRFANDLPLNAEAERDVWYSFEPEGYVDFPTVRQPPVEVGNESGS